MAEESDAGKRVVIIRYLTRSAKGIFKREQAICKRKYSILKREQSILKREVPILKRERASRLQIERKNPLFLIPSAYSQTGEARKAQKIRDFFATENANLVSKLASMGGGLNMICTFFPSSSLGS